MSETINYKLYVTDDSSERVQDVRKRIYGEQDSNMVKIDEILGQKAERSIAVYATLAHDSWSGTSAPYTQPLSIREILTTQNGFVALAENATPEQIRAASAAGLFVSSQANGILTIGANKTQPNIDIPVTITLLG